MVQNCSSWTELDIGSSLPVRDHEVVALEVHMLLSHISKTALGKQYDWEAMHTPEGKKKAQQIVKDIPEPSWEVDVHTHWQRLQEGLHEGLAEAFPVKQKRTRGGIFSTGTWKALARRKHAKATMQRCDEYTHDLNQQAAFRAWKDGTDFSLSSRVQILDRAATVLCLLRGLAHFRTAAKEVRELIKADKAGFVELVVDKAEAAQGVDLYKELRPLRIGGRFRKGASAHPGFAIDGEQARDHLHNEKLWLRYCARLEAGVETSTSRLLQRARKGAASRRQQLQSTFSLEDAPTLSMLEGAFRHVKKAKAGGLDGFKSDLCVAAPREMAQRFFPIMVKTLVGLEEPIQMKGGLVINAYKGGGCNPADPSNHRSLLLSSHAGKAIRRVFRKQLLPAYEASAPDTFFSIRTGGNVAHASHALRLYATAASRGGDSIGILFLDVKAAYYRVLRQLVVEGRGQESLERVMRYFDLGASDFQHIMEELHGYPEGKHSNLSEHQELLLEELMSATWLTGQHRTAILETLAGSRPGDGFADLIFGFAFKRIMRRVFGRLTEEFQFQEVDLIGPFDPTGDPPECTLPEILQVVWADDLAVAYRCKGAMQLVEAMRRISTVVFQECLRHGLVPNLKRGKTEILLMLKGEGSRSAKAQYFNGTDPKLFLDEMPEEFQNVSLVHTYRHLGTRMHIGQKMLPELKARCGQAGATFRKYRRQIFQNARISLRKRLFLFNSLVASIMEFNAGTWSGLSKGEWAYFNKRILNMYRSIARATIKEEELRLWSNDRILAYLQVPSPEVIVNVARLRYMISLHRSAPKTLWHLIGAEGGWLSHLHQSQYWMESHLMGYGPDKSGHDWKPAWTLWLDQGGDTLKSWIRKAKAHAILEHSKQVEWKEFHFVFLNACLDAGWQHEFPWPRAEDFQNQEQVDACLACGLVFKNKAAWSVHAFRIHGRYNPCRRVMGSTRCDACSKEYRSTSRLLAHLRYSRKCYQKLVGAGKTYEEILPGIGSRREMKDGPPPVPVLPSEGPQERQLQEDGLGHDPEYDLDLLEGLVECFLTMPVDTSLEDGISLAKECFVGSTSSMQTLKETATYFAQELENDDMHRDWPIGRAMVKMISEITARRCRAAWFFSADQIKAPIDDQALRDAAWDFCRRSKERWIWNRRSYIPRFGSNLLFWLHFCSGERRSDDVQAYLETLRPPDGYVMRILSVDIIYDPIAGNLACPVNQAVWLRHIDRGYVIGFLAGPPCESWSRARLHGGVAGWSAGDGGPRVLRTAEVPEGLFTMTVAEQQQALLGNRLLCFIMLAFVHMLRIARFAMVEHPSSSLADSEAWLASIWKLFLTEVLAANEFVRKIDIFQGLFGARSPKPTSLLFCVGPNLDVQTTLDQGHTVSEMPRQLEMGWDRKAGEYATASLKNYPQILCAAISKVCQQWLDRYLPETPPSVSEPDSIAQFVQFTEQLERSFNFSAQRGSDFHR